jgi:hypothetical protein
MKPGLPAGRAFVEIRDGQPTDIVMHAFGLSRAHLRCVVASLASATFAVLPRAGDAAEGAGAPRRSLVLTVSNDGARECPEATELEAAVMDVRGLESAAPEAPIAARIAFRRDGTALVARIDVLGPNAGTREFRDDARGCEAVAAAVVTTLAMVVDARSPSDDRSALEAREAESTTRVDGASARDMPGKPASAERAARLGAGGRIFVGALPETAPGIALEASIRTRTGVSAGIGAFLARTSTATLPPGEVDVSLFAAEARGCVTPLRATSLHFPACASLLVGRIRAEGRGYMLDEASAQLWGALGAELGAEGPIAGPVGWALRAGAIVPLFRQSAAVESAGIAWESRPVAATASATVTVSIW